MKANRCSGRRFWCSLKLLGIMIPILYLTYMTPLIGKAFGFEVMSQMDLFNIDNPTLYFSGIFLGIVPTSFARRIFKICSRYYKGYVYRMDGIWSKEYYSRRENIQF